MPSIAARRAVLEDEGPHRRPRARHRAPDRRCASACCRVPTVRRCSRAAKRRRWVTATLGTDEGLADHRRAGRRMRSERFMFHYNFPPYCGRRNRPPRPGRSAAKSATAAWPSAALPRSMPDAGIVPVRACASCLGDHRIQRLVVDGLGAAASALALMDAGVPLIKAPVAGVAMGLDPGRRPTSPCCPTSSATKTTSATWTSRWRVPHDGVTALQMDIKIDGITDEIMQTWRWTRPRRPPAHPRRDEQGHAEAAHGKMSRLRAAHHR